MEIRQDPRRLQIAILFTYDDEGKITEERRFVDTEQCKAAL